MGKKGFYLKSEKITITPSNEEDLWESDWVVAFRKGEKEQIGTASFAGEKILGAVPLQVEVISQVEHENDKGVNALQKAGFVFRGNEGNVETYSILKAQTTWTGVYVAVGIVVGMILGLTLNNLWLGFAGGMISCLCIGTIMDYNAKKYRESVTGKSVQSGKRSRK